MIYAHRPLPLQYRLPSKLFTRPPFVFFRLSLPPFFPADIYPPLSSFFSLHNTINYSQPKLQLAHLSRLPLLAWALWGHAAFPFPPERLVACIPIQYGAYNTNIIRVSEIGFTYHTRALPTTHLSCFPFCVALECRYCAVLYVL